MTTAFHQKLTNRCSGGVTLVEMLVVVAIASILLAVVFPAVGSGLGTLELRSAATRVAAAARYARDQAVYRQRMVQLTLDSAQGSVTITGGEPLERRYELPDSVRIARVLPADTNAGDGIRRFVFLPDGAAPEFEVVLTNERAEIAVIGDPLTGTARVREQKRKR